jgi:1,2-diacylglycerol 3-alpha-glucosyltransferase
MKILITTDEYIGKINGVTTSVLTLKEELIKKGHEVRVLALSQDRKSMILNGDYFIGSFVILKKTQDRFTFKWNDKLIKKIICWKPDIIHAQSEFATYLLARKIAKACNIPIIHTCHAMYEYYTDYFFPNKKIGKKIIEILSNKIYNKSKLLIVPSLKLKKAIENYNVNTRIEVIPTGIDIENYQKKLAMNEKKKILEKLKIFDTNKILVLVSRLNEEKNIDEIISFMPNLLLKDGEVKLIIVGDGPYRKTLEEKVKRLKITNNVFFTGMIAHEEIYKYYQLGNIFVCASQSESQGLTYIEALANKLPLVCKKDLCLTGIIEEGINGYMFDDEKQFEESILKILNDKKLQNRMKKNSYNKMDKFTKEQFCNLIEKEYLKIVE